MSPIHLFFLFGGGGGGIRFNWMDTAWEFWFVQVGPAQRMVLVLTVKS